MRLVLLVAASLFLVTGCSSTSIPSGTSAGRERSGRVYLIRGMLTPLSLGVDRMARGLRASELDATTHSHLQTGAIALSIERNASRREPIVLVGYSSGSNNALDLARRLGRSGIPVDLLVTIDPLPVLPANVPANVRRCVNYYHSIVPGVPFLSGRRVIADDPDSTKLTNTNFGRTGPHVGFLHHFNMDEQPVINSEVGALILNCCPPREANLVKRSPEAPTTSSRTAG